MNIFMNLAIAEAQKAKGFQLPNPRVGAVIVKDNKVIGKGHHALFGSDHAEVDAINNAKKNGHDLIGSTIYVTLQPCSKKGKTPPCSKAIIDEGITSVVIGTVDKTDTKSIEILKSKNIIVEILNDNNTVKLIEDFNWNNTAKKPFVIGKLAIDKSGASRANKKKNIWISNKESQYEGKKIRSEVQAILVGDNTIRIDDPILKALDGSRNPIIITISPEFNIPYESNIFKSDTKKIIFIKKDTLVEELENVEFIRFEGDTISTNDILDHLYKRDIKSLLVEGGKETLMNFIDEDNINKLFLFVTSIEDKEYINLITDKDCHKLQSKIIKNNIMQEYCLKGKKCLQE